MLDLSLLTLLAIALALGGSILFVQTITGVPPMSSNAVEAADIIALLREAEPADGAIIYELGCGWGSLAMALAHAWPHAEIRGIELSPLPYWVARFRTRNLANVHLTNRNFYRCDLRDADAVVCYLMIKAMPKLAVLLDETLKPGVPVVSLAFWFRGRRVAARRQNGGLLGQVALYYWPARDADEHDRQHPNA